MLEQRRAQEKGYITLKEAAEISDYAPDYIGQLIRSGKIKGEQVYSNVAWVTTEEEIQRYIAQKNGQISGQKDVSELLTESVLVKRFTKVTLYILIGVFALAIMLMQYILYVSLDDSLGERLFHVSEAREEL